MKMLHVSTIDVSKGFKLRPRKVDAKKISKFRKQPIENLAISNYFLCNMHIQSEDIKFHSIQL